MLAAGRLMLTPARLMIAAGRLTLGAGGLTPTTGPLARAASSASRVTIVHRKGRFGLARAAVSPRSPSATPVQHLAQSSPCAPPAVARDDGASRCSSSPTQSSGRIERSVV